MAALGAEQMEVLARRVARLSHDWNHDKVHFRSIVSFDQPRSVTWLRIVHGRFLFVASSDTQASGFACWDIGSAFLDEKKPIAECFFAGPVQGAAIEVQDEGVVIAVSVESWCENFVILLVNNA